MIRGYYHSPEIKQLLAIRRQLKDELWLELSTDSMTNKISIKANP
jgi:hypothetical protein